MKLVMIVMLYLISSNMPGQFCNRKAVSSS